MDNIQTTIRPPLASELCLSAAKNRREIWFRRLGEGFLFSIAGISFIIVFFIFYFILKDALPFLKEAKIGEFFFNKQWYPAADTPIFGALSIIWGTFMVTMGAAIIAIPLGVIVAVCLSDILSFQVRQIVKPVIEILAAIPSVAYGFFALVILAPFLQNNGVLFMQTILWGIGLPLSFIFIWLIVENLITKYFNHFLFKQKYCKAKMLIICGSLAICICGIMNVYISKITIYSGTNALNVSLVLALMALPTIVSLSEDALQAIPKEIREGSYALGATKAETLIKIIIPAASSGIISAIILGMMRVVGETMVVWMASGNAAQIPQPFFNFLEPIRTLTATIAGEMGEVDQSVGSVRYHVLFLMAFILLCISMFMNMLSNFLSERKKRRGM